MPWQDVNRPELSDLDAPDGSAEEKADTDSPPRTSLSTKLGKPGSVAAAEYH